MESTLIQALRDCQSHIRTRWENLLRQEQIHTALANPDLLVRLFDGTLDAVFDHLKLSTGTLTGPLTLSMKEIRDK